MEVLKNIADDLSEKYGISDIAISVISGSGFCEHLNSTEQYPIYSITKTIIATLLLKLAECGRVDLDAPANRYVEDAPEGDQYSLREILNHTAGLPDYYGLPKYRHDVKFRPGEPWTRAEYLQNTYQGQRLFKTGHGWMYSNLGYMLLNDAIQSITGLTLAQVLQVELIDPLGLHDTKMLETPSDLLNLVPSVSGHITSGVTPAEVRGRYHPGWVAHGVASSTTRDVAKFFDALFRGVILGKRQLQQMTTLVRVPGEHPPAVSPSYGLGLMGDPDSPLGFSYGHGGGGPGYVVHANYWQEIAGGTVVVLFTNAESANTLQMMDHLGQSLSSHKI